MKHTFLIGLFLLAISSKAQKSKQNELSYSNFDKKILNYHPDKTKTSEKSFEEGSLFLKEVKKRISNNNNNLDVSDYFNLLSAFISLNESKKNIKTVFEKFKDAEGSCGYILSYEDDIEKSSLYDVIREEYTKELEKCKTEPTAEKEINILEYSKINNLNLSLIRKINKIKLDDQKYRGNSYNENKSKQTQLDKQNQKEIDSLFKVYKSYVGNTLVGKKFKPVMWAVIQHSNPEMMERYLPIVQKAVSEKELSVGLFKMLIDRIYWLKYNYQVFGSQPGVRIADEKTRNGIIKKYGIE